MLGDVRTALKGSRDALSSVSVLVCFRCYFRRLTLSLPPLKIKSAFNVGEKRMWHIQVKTLAKAGQWKELGRLTANKKVCRGGEPVVEACV